MIGHLSHAATVVQHGRTFMRRMFDLVKRVKQAHHHVRLSQDFRSDLQWWALFLPQWNGKSILHPAAPQHVVTADASGSWGCGAFGLNRCWFQLQWPQSWSMVHIAAKELVPIVMAVAMWGAEWQASTVLIRSDNDAVVSSLSSGSAKDATLMHLLRCLHFYLAQFDIRVVARHIAGAVNTAADALSRDNRAVFFQLTPQAKKHPSHVPPALQELLLLQSPDWLSPTWRKLFLATLSSP